MKESEQEKKGFIIYDTISNEHEFVHIDSRDFAVLRIDEEDATPNVIAEKCEAAIKKELESHGKKPIIRVVVEGSLAQGYTGADLLLQSIAKKYSQKAVIDIDASRLETPELKLQIENVRDGKLDGLPLKDRGMQILKSRLKEYKYSEKMDSARLFEILSSGTSKEKTLKEALESLYENYEV